MKLIKVIAALYVLIQVSLASAEKPAKITLEAESASFNTERVEKISNKDFKSGLGIALVSGIAYTTDTQGLPPDVSFKVNPGQAGRYEIITNSAPNALGRQMTEKAKTKHDSLYMTIAVGDQRPVRRVLYVPWADPKGYVETIGNFELQAGEQTIRIWLPAGVQLDYLSVTPYVPPAVPPAAIDYKPRIVPGEAHPRLWVNPETLPKVRDNLTRGENAAVWKKVQAEASKPFAFAPKPDESLQYDSALENAAANKAFVYLMTGDKKLGREAISLIQPYLEQVEFSNLLDITREIGRAMYAGARVYDWCYDLMTQEERESMRKNMMRLADDMEIGWPPFKQIVVNGHGSEGQLFCHLLSMAIAIYSEDPQPYRYCAYRILEELVPMRTFEYQSHRHNQGLGYGIYRFTWDMHAAWLFYRMSGQKIFDNNFEKVSRYWLETRLPGGSNFPDGDGNADGRRTNLGLLSLMASAYANDPVMKSDFIRQGGLPGDPLMVLLLNDPDLKATKDFSSLPRTFDFGPIMGGMVTRTGWNLDEKSTDVVVFMTGGGYNFFNHQQSDAGSFQVYYHGKQVVDLGQYVFYGTPYDKYFNKRSIAHSMMLAHDPTSSKTAGNDGGTRPAISSPNSVEQLTGNPGYLNGTVVSTDCAPSVQSPNYSYFSVDLTSAYVDTIKKYVRSFCFLDLKGSGVPAVLIISDYMETARPGIRKYWQVNTLNAPRQTPDGLVLASSESGTTGLVHLQMLRPGAENQKVEIHSGKDSTNVFGQQYTPPKPDDPTAQGHRIQISPVKAEATDQFLTVLTMAEDTQATTSIQVLGESEQAYVLSVADRIVILAKGGQLLDAPVSFNVSNVGKVSIVATGLSAGKWELKSTSGATSQQIEVAEKKNTATFIATPGSYMLQPVR